MKMLDLKNNVEYYDEKNTFHSSKLRLRYDGEYVYYDTVEIKSPRISSHTLVDMVGLNKYSSAGKTIMSIFGLTKKSPIDPYQIYKGGIAEVFAKRYLEHRYGQDADVESFTVSQFKKGNQFPDEVPFSGVLDLVVHLPIKLPVEVKSKEMKDYDTIVTLEQYPRDQIAQGANQALLAHVDQFMMLWVFLTPYVSELLKSLVKEDCWIWKEDYEQAVRDLDLKTSDFQIHAKIFDLDPRLIRAYREKALSLYNEFYVNRRISKKLFTADELKEIQIFIKQNSTLE